MNTAAATDHADATANCHDYALVRTNERTGADYNIWVSVDDYTPYSPATWSDPGEEAQVEATGWGTLGNEIELTQDELDEVLLAVEEDRLGTPAPAGVVHTDLAQREQLFSGGCPHLAAVFHNMSSIPATGF